MVRAIEDSTSTEKCEWSSEPMGLLAAQGSGDPSSNYGISFENKSRESLKMDINRILNCSYNSKHKPYCYFHHVLYILNSVWVLRTPNAGRNLHFQHFFPQKS